MEEREMQHQELIAALIRAVGRTSSLQSSFNQAFAATLRISATDLECLTLLEDLGPTPAGQLADVLGLTTGAITGIIDRLGARGFVVRESDPTDRRRVIVRPVLEQMAELDQAFAPVVQSAIHFFGPYSHNEVRMLLEFQRLMGSLLETETDRFKAQLARSESVSRYTAPLGAASAGTLEFANGASGLRISADTGDDELFHGDFEQPQPAVQVVDGKVSFRYPRMGVFDWGKTAARVALNRRIPWRIVLRGGARDVHIDAQKIDLGGLSIEGGADKVDIELGLAAGGVPVCIRGGANRVHIRRVLGVQVELQVRGGANRLQFDGEWYGEVGGDIRLASELWEQVEDRYSIEVRGGASRLDVDHY